MKSNLEGDTGVDPEVISQASCFSGRSKGLGRLWSMKKLEPIRNSGSIEKLFLNGMGVESNLKVSLSVPKIQIKSYQ
jgi:hypothetical protein